ncbi:MAG: glycosyltransferase family 4 protein [Deltaproteobacteria bacterium]|nr:glycosyltransferase family 4 protein [Deltaproteobacteria bacterium]
MAEVLFVSKPVVPPWHDSSKNLVKDLACAMTRHTPLVMGRRGLSSALDLVEALPVYRRAGGFAPGLVDQLAVFQCLLSSRRGALWHFFFAPNPKSSMAGRLAARVRGRKSVHTVCSAPREDADLSRVLFADLTVVLSRATEVRLLESGVDPGRLRRIPPAIVPLTPPGDSQILRLRTQLGLPEGPLYVFPGDLEFGVGGQLAVECLAALPDAHLVMACRAKTAAAASAEAQLRLRAQSLGLESRITWVGETPRIHDYLACADVVTLVSETLYAKMDYPLVLLEAMSLSRPVLVASGTPAAELARPGGCAAVAPERDAMLESLGELLGDAGARDQAGRAAREYVLEQHAPAAMAAAYEALYDELLA